MRRNCPRCGKNHEMAYVYHSNYTKHLVLLHKGLNNKGKEYIFNVYIKFEDNLDIPVIKTYKQKKKERLHLKEVGVAGQISLLT